MAVKQSDAVKSGLMPDLGKPGTVLFRKATYTCTATANAPVTVEMIPIPAGAMIIDVILAITAFTSDADLDVGDGSDSGRFMVNVDAGTSAIYHLGDEDANADVADGYHSAFYVYTSQDTIDVVVTDSDFTSDDKFSLGVMYTMTGTIEDENP